MNLKDTLQKIKPADAAMTAAARARFQSLAMPLGSMGLLGEAVVQLAGAQGRVIPDIGKRALVVFCADNGVVAQGVTQCGQEVTAVVTENFARGQTTSCLMAARLGVDVIPVDIGVARDVVGEKIRRHKIGYGTRDLSTQPAMTRKECVRAIETGAAIAAECAAAGYGLLCTGEMGIGNTTTTAAVTAALLGLPPEEVTGRGAGLSSEGLSRKIKVIDHALSLHQPDPSDPIDVLSKVGGFDLAGICGLYLGGAACGVPVVMDGVIASAAALAAVRLCPAARDYILPSHRSDEPACGALLGALDAKPCITAGMRLGEGTGALAAVSLFDLALAVYGGMATFEEMEIDAYQPLT